MSSASWLCHPASAKRPSPSQLQAVLGRARALSRPAGRQPPPLLGRQLGLMSVQPEGPDALLFQRAAQELGAHVALIAAPAEPRDVDSRQLAGIGRLLGRLYDAVEYQGPSHETACHLATAGNIPVYAGLATREHPIFELTTDWGGAAPLHDRRRWLTQAALLASLL